MAESVDALVSNTSGATRAGSTPALGTKKPLNLSIRRFFFFGGDSDELSSQELSSEVQECRCVGVQTIDPDESSSQELKGVKGQYLQVQITR